MICLNRPAGRAFGLVATVLLASLAVAPAASADTVLFRTTGTFANGSSTTQVGSSVVTFNNGSGDLDVDNPGFSFANLGSFATTSAATTNQHFDVDFTLLIKQLEPTVGQNTLSGELSGTLRRRNSTLEIVFDSVSTSIDPVTYALRNLTGNVLTLNYGLTSLDAQVSLNPGTVNAVPLPAAAWGGIALMGMIGAIKVRRRRATAG